MPKLKYYDLYTIDKIENCKIDTCGGHALYETAGWHNDYKYFVDSDKPWFSRGGFYGSRQIAGAFNSLAFVGGFNNDASWRSVLVSRNGT